MNGFDDALQVEHTKDVMRNAV